jgi:hypothetical protein
MGTAVCRKCLDLEQSRAKYKNGYYAEKLEEGLEFQDVVTSALFQRGIVVVAYASRRFQQTHGENMLGAEIKRDGNFRKTGNLYIETAEKSHPDNPSYVASGIYREDNSWLFVIGDERAVWIFSTKYLRLLSDRRGWKHKETATSQGFLVPIADADRYCIRKIDLEKEAA